MDDQLDNDLKNRIREVFDNYEDTSADEGWLLLREKFPEQQSKRPAFAWRWWGAAAILLAVIGAGLWLRSGQDTSGVSTVKMVKHHQSDRVPDEQTVEDPSNKIARTTTPLPDKTGAPNYKVPKRNNYQTISPAVAAAATIAVQKSETGWAKKPLLTDTGTTKNNLVANNIIDSLKPQAGNTAPSLPAIAESQIANATKVPVVQEKKPEKTIMDMFASDKGKQPAKNDGELSDKAGRKVNFGVYAATYFNYAKGSDNQVNAGAGFTSDIKLNKNLKLVTGIAIAQNSLSYQGFPTLAASAKSNLYTNAAPNPGTMTYAITSAPTVRNYNASLIGLDIPINLKYEFNPQKNDSYVSLGLSSGTFIDESYTYKYNYPSFLSSNLQQPRNESTGNNFNSFYFAKTLNVAFGMGYPFGKNRLVIEPFLKYPLDGMGSQNLRFGAGGVNLKFNFLPSQKK